MPTPAAARGWRNAAGALWAAAVVARLLRYDYAATTIARKFDGKSYDYVVEPIVAAEVAAAVVEIRSARPKIARHSDGRNERITGADARTGTNALLQGRMRCGLCGRRWRVGSSGNKTNRHLSYHCAGRLKYGRAPGEAACQAPRIKVRDLDPLVFEAVRRILVDAPAFDRAARRYVRSLEERLEEAHPGATQAAERIAELTELRRRTVVNGARYDEDVSAEIERFDAQLKELRGTVEQNRRLAAGLEHVRAERDRMEAALRDYGGRFWIPEVEPGDENLESVVIYYERQAEADERYFAKAFRGEQRISRTELVDMVELSALLDGRLVTLTGAVTASEATAAALPFEVTVAVQ